MNFRKLTIYLAFSLTCSSQAYQVFGQTINLRFEKLVISENFDSAGTVWQTTANKDNLFLVQNGEYILQRKSTESPYAVMGNLQREFDEFRLLTSLKLSKAFESNASVGILFMAQSGGNGGFILEINKDNQYRIRQISEGVYLYITGTQKDGGWIRMPASTHPDAFHLVEITRAGNKYDLFINKSYQNTFSDPGYEAGSMGYIIGPSSQGKIDYMYIFEKSDKEIAIPDTLSNASTGPDMAALAESVIVLKQQVNDLTEENEALRKTISAMKSGEDESAVNLRNYEKQVAYLNDEIDQRDLLIDSLERANNKLMKYKEIVGNDESADIIINLSTSLKKETEKRKELQQENSILRERLGLPKSGKLKLSDPDDSGEGDSFKLPGDN